MNIVLSPETQRLLEERMKQGQFATADDALRTALESVEQVGSERLEDLDPGVLRAIERAEAQSARGEAMPWSQVREEIRSKYVKR